MELVTLANVFVVLTCKTLLPVVQYNICVHLKNNSERHG